jgi:osmoprotectant transport system permease protein
MKWCLLILIISVSSCSNPKNEIITGSKKFTESVILGEIIKHTGFYSGVDVLHKEQLGGTRVLWNSLLNGEIDLYPDYTGTIIQEILNDKNISTENEMTRELDKLGIKVTGPLGFNNTYAIGIKKKKENLTKISQLNDYPDWKLGFTNEFMDRNDGWPGLRNHYNLIHKNVTGLDHDLAYRGLESGSIDVIDLYSTDAEIKYYNINVLEDDLNYFPVYNAVILYRKELEETNPAFVKNLLLLKNSINEKKMVEMNSSVKIDKEKEDKVAAEFVKTKFDYKPEIKEETLISRLLKNTKEHLFLVIISLLGAILFSIPLGIIAYKIPQLKQLILNTTGIIQTIPSLALLVFMIPFFGIGEFPAIAALFLYSLLPIVRNTFLGIENIPLQTRESAVVLGLSNFTILKKIELPLASRSIIAGIKTSAVINVGTATLGALIGAGGFGQPILTGIRLDDIQLILEGAIPAALLAIIVQWLFELSEKIFVPKGLRIN